MADKNISKVRQKKEAIVAEVTAKVQKAKGFVFTNYQGLTHQQLEAIKRAMRKLDAEYVATKNTLLKRSLIEGFKLSLPKVDQSLAENLNFDGPTATLFIYNDPIEPIKELTKSIKAHNLPVVRIGIIDGQMLDASQIDRLSKLPGFNVLRAQLLGQLQSPISGLYRALNWNLQKLVLTLNAVKEKKN